MSLYDEMDTPYQSMADELDVDDETLKMLLQNSLHQQYTQAVAAMGADDDVEIPDAEE